MILRIVETHLVLMVPTRPFPSELQRPMGPHGRRRLCGGPAAVYPGGIFLRVPHRPDAPRNRARAGGGGLAGQQRSSAVGALDAAKLGSWQYDPIRRVFSWDARSKEIFGVPEDGATVEEFMNWVHPDDVERVWVAYHRALDPAQPERSPTQFRLRPEDGKVRWVETQGLARLEGRGATDGS
jgi:PAS domain-containing protein